MDSSSQSFELSELKQAFHMLTSVSEKMELSYERLKGQAEELKQELFEKNARLIKAIFFLHLDIQNNYIWSICKYSV